MRVEIPSAHHLAVHCSPKAFNEYDGQGVPVGIGTAAFRVDDDGVSFNWVEFEDLPTFQDCLKATSDGFRVRRKVKKSDRIGVFNVGEIAEEGQAFDKVLVAIHDPIAEGDHGGPNPGHALLTGVSMGDDDLLLALTTLVTLHLAI